MMLDLKALGIAKEIKAAVAKPTLTIILRRSISRLATDPELPYSRLISAMDQNSHIAEYH